MEVKIKDIRKRWLRSWKALLGSHIISILIFTLAGLLVDTKEERSEASFGIIFLILSGLWLFFCYRCSYKKPGSKLLSFYLVLSVFGLLRGFSDFFITLHDDLFGFFINLIGISLSVWFFITSVELLAFNKDLRKGNSESCS